MKIGIYARGLDENTGGVKEYIISLINSIIKNINLNDDFYIIHNSKNKLLPTKRKNVHEIYINSKNKLLSDFILAPFYINKLKLESILFPKNVIPYFVSNKTKKVVTVHDLAHYFSQLNAYKFIDTFYMKFMIKSSCKRANKIIAISENTKKDIINIFSNFYDKITVIYEAVDNRFKQIKNKKMLQKIKKKYNLKEKFIFYAGSISPRKNLKRLIAAFNKVQDKVGLNLVITGNKIWNNEEEMIMIQKNPRIKVLGFVPDADLPYLYNLSFIYVYPSLYEGFGLPILEAQACGCPVIAANKSSLPEVTGKGAILIDPYNVDEIGGAIIELSQKKNLRNKLIKAGFKNVKRFSWKKTAKDTLEVIKNA